MVWIGIRWQPDADLSWGGCSLAGSGRSGAGEGNRWWRRWCVGCRRSPVAVPVVVAPAPTSASAAASGNLLGLAPVCAGGAS